MKDDSTNKKAPRPTGARKPWRIGVVGGSLAGLTSALLLREAGCEVDVYERSSVERAGYGAGMAMHEPTTRYLVERAGRRLDEITLERPFQRFLARDGSVLDEQARATRFSTWGTLYRGLIEEYGQGRIHAHTTVTGVSDDGGKTGATIVFADGSSRSFDVVIAADGIQSSIRASLGVDTEFRSAGYVGWRGLVPRSHLSEATWKGFTDGVTYFLADDYSHIITYPVPRGLDDDESDEDRLNYVWYRNFDDETHLDEILTDASGVRRPVSVSAGAVPRQNIERLREDAQELLAPQFAELVCATEQPFVQLIGDLAIDQMVFGRTVLIGDAAFVARPHPAAGSAKAGVDAWSLAFTVANASDDTSLERDLAVWERARLHEGRRLVDCAVSQGDVVQRHGRWPPGNTFYIPDLFTDANSRFEVPRRDRGVT